MKKKAKNVRREVYPKPEHRFSNVKIGMTYHDSKPDFPPLDNAPPHAPNIVLVLLDDVGYGWPSACGGLVRMPAAENLAREGLTYCQFHTTGLCAPTRAALLTGRNHHSVSTGVVQEMATGFPATAESSREVARLSARYCHTTDTPPGGGARTTTHPTARPARPDHSPTGQLAWDSTTSMDLWEEKRTNSGSVPKHRARGCVSASSAGEN